MKDLLQTIVEPLVTEPEAIEIHERRQGYRIVLDLSVARQDIGKVIGRGGRRAQAIRSIMKARASLEGKRVVVNID